MAADGPTPFGIRSFQPGDLQACQSLFKDGMISAPANGACDDIHDIDAHFIQTPGNHFWVAVWNQMPLSECPELATAGGEWVVGMIGVRQCNGVAEIRRLRVSTPYRRRGIGSALIETALQFCRDHDCLKVTLDTFVDREPAIKLFDKFRFRHSRSKMLSGKELMYFYLDLYTPQTHAESDEARQQA